MGIGPMTSVLPRRRSATELPRRILTFISHSFLFLIVLIESEEAPCSKDCYDERVNKKIFGRDLGHLGTEEDQYDVDRDIEKNIYN